MVASRLSIDRIEEAARSIDPAFRNSPQYEYEALSRRLGSARCIVKVETLNPVRSFKGRGADFFVSKLPSDVDRLVCASAGNFGWAMAWACRKYGLRLDVFASIHASRLKLASIEATSASVHLEGHDFDAAKDHGREFAHRLGVPFIEDGREPEISEGAGSIGVELARLPYDLDQIFVPLGNGALVSGIARWMKFASPSTRVVAVSAAAAPAMEQSWRRLNVVETETAATIADGIGVRVPIPEAVDEMRILVDDVALVGDKSIRLAMRQAFDELGLVLEPAGAAALAAVRYRQASLRNQRFAIILGGSNVSLDHFCRLIGN